jgi:DNA-directed RNA polymerase II subunit RPB2
VALAEKVLLGSVPIMLRSKYCVLNERETSAGDMYGFKECPLDVGGYFVVNGTEKVCRLILFCFWFHVAQVIIAQERMASNNVYVFERKESKYLLVAEIRSVLDDQSRPARYPVLSLSPAVSLFKALCL